MIYHRRPFGKRIKTALLNGESTSSHSVSQHPGAIHWKGMTVAVFGKEMEGGSWKRQLLGDGLSRGHSITSPAENQPEIHSGWLGTSQKCRVAPSTQWLPARRCPEKPPRKPTQKDTYVCLTCVKFPTTALKRCNNQNTRQRPRTFEATSTP